MTAFQKAIVFLVAVALGCAVWMGRYSNTASGVVIDRWTGTVYGISGWRLTPLKVEPDR